MDVSGVDTEREIAEQERWERNRRRMAANAALWLVLLGIVLLVVLAPRIASRPAMRERIVALVNGRIAPASMAVDDWTLRWRGGQKAAGVRYADPIAGVAAAVEQVEVSAGLLSLLPWRAVNAGTVTLRQPYLRLAQTRRAAAEKDGAGDMEALETRAVPLPEEDEAPLPRPAGGAAPARDTGGRQPSARDQAAAKTDGAAQRLMRLPLQGTLKVEGGRVALEDPLMGGIALADNVEGELVMAGWDKALSLAWQARTPLGEGAGSVALRGELPPPRLLLERDFAAPACRGELHAAVRALDLRAVAPLLAASIGHEWVKGGVVDLKADISFNGRGHGAAEVDMAVAQLSVVAPGLAPSPPGDVKLALSGKRDEHGFALHSCVFSSPWGSLTAGGRLETSALNAALLGHVKAAGRIEVAALLRDFRSLLGTDEALRAERGVVTFSAALEGTARERLISGEVRADGMRILYDNEPLQFTPAPQAAMKLRLPYSEPPELERLDVSLPFARISGSGRFDKGEISGEVDLAALSRDYRRLVKMCPPMIGQVIFRIAAGRDGAHSRVDAAASVEDLALQLAPGRRVVVQQGDARLVFSIPLAEEMPQPVAERLAWNCVFEGGAASGTVARVELPLRGRRFLADGMTAAFDLDLARLAGSLRTLLPLPAGAVVQGRALLNATAAAEGGHFEGRFSAAGHNLLLQTTAWEMRERSVGAEGAVALDRPAATAAVTSLALDSAAVRMKIPRLVMNGWGQDGRAAFDGNVELDADLGVIGGWRRPRRDGSRAPEIGGRVDARVEAAAAGEATRLTLDGALSNLKLALPADGKSLQERKITARGVAALSRDGTKLAIESGALASEWATLNLKGNIDDLRGAAAAALEGSLAVDYDVLGRRAAATGTGLVAAAGKPAARKFTFRGDLGRGLAPLRSFAELKGSLGVGELRILQLNIAPDEMAFDLRDGVLALGYQPAAGKGRIRLNPVTQVAVDPPLLEIGGQRPLLERVPLTQAMTDTLLAMVNPLLRGCLAGEGAVSLELGETVIPLAAAAKNEIDAGLAVTLHDCPFAAAGILGEILDLAGIERKEVLIKQTVIHARCRNGRVETEPFEMVVNNHTLRFHGSVGLDQTVAYVVEVPLSRKLVGKELWPYIGGVTVRVPVGGTLANLKLDRDAAKKEVTRLLREAAGKALGGAALENINKLLGN